MKKKTATASRGDDATMGELGLGEDPLGLDPLVEHFYQRPSALSAPSTRTPRSDRTKGRQPLRDGQSYRLVTFSFYEEDVARLDALLCEAKRLGHRRVSRSQIVRLALRQVDVKDLPELI